MRLALRLAARAIGATSPNPVVGAVLVKRGRIVGKGYHRQAGLAHAEVEALRKAGERAAGSTLYVTLEPCHHIGRTPPCCDAIIRAGIRRVVIATHDPNPITNGRGLARLRRAGIRLSVGVLEEDAQRLVAPFRKAITAKLPWMIVKIAQSLDGKIAANTGQSRWISSVPARAFTHRLRHQVDAILVGVNTILQDDPDLTARGFRSVARAGRPIVVVVDSRLRTPVSSLCLSDPVPRLAILATTTRAAAKHEPFVRRGIEVVSLPPSPDGRVPLRRLCHTLLMRYGITSVLVEGGGEVVASAFAERLVDRLVWVIAPLIIGGCRSPCAVGGKGIARLSQAVRLRDVRVRRLGPDLVLDARVTYPAQNRPPSTVHRLR